VSFQSLPVPYNIMEALLYVVYVKFVDQNLNVVFVSFNW